MILRRAERLSETDNLRLDRLLWNVSRVRVAPDGVHVLLTRANGAKYELDLLHDDMIQLAT